MSVDSEELRSSRSVVEAVLAQVRWARQGNYETRGVGMVGSWARPSPATPEGTQKSRLSQARALLTGLTRID